jgi:hypothetical protein
MADIVAEVGTSRIPMSRSGFDGPLQARLTISAL